MTAGPRRADSAPGETDAQPVRRVLTSFYTPASCAQPLSLVQLEKVVCNLCGGAGYARLGEELGFEIRKCRDCGLVYVSPQPSREDLPKFYEGMYVREEHGPVELRSLGLVESQVRRILQKRKPQGGRLLEVGCGYGLLLRELSSLPFECTALEASESAVSVARQHAPHATICVGIMEDFSFDPESFDCIVLVAVLEHMKDPRAALNRLHDWLVSGGLLVLVVPYVEWFFRVKQRLPWLPIYFEAPRHLFDFSPTVLRRYLRETAFEQTAMEIGLPGWARSSFHAALIWGVKVPGIVLHWLTGGRYIYPFASSVVAHAVKGTGCRPAAATQPHH